MSPRLVFTNVHVTLSPGSRSMCAVTKKGGFEDVPVPKSGSLQRRSLAAQPAGDKARSSETT